MLNFLEEERTCVRCKNTRNMKWFAPVLESRKPRYSVICLFCVAKDAGWQVNPRFKERKKKSKRSDAERVREIRTRKRDEARAERYGISVEWIQQTRVEQGDACAICKRKFGARIREHLDHCHTTKKLRGLLCNYCNSALGMVRDDVNVLAAMIKYITRHQ